MRVAVVFTTILVRLRVPLIVAIRNYKDSACSVRFNWLVRGFLTRLVSVGGAPTRRSGQFIAIFNNETI